MQTFDNIEFHNAAGLEDMPGFNGKILCRVPESVRNKLQYKTRPVVKESVVSEIRFVSDAPTLKITLACIKGEEWGDAEARIFRGNFEYQSHALKPGQLKTITLSRPPMMDQVRPEILRQKGFSPDVWRIIFSNGCCGICDIESFGYEVRRPRADEKPAKTLLAHGSSITHSGLDGYPFVAARRLGLDFINLGSSGTCQVEAPMADFIAERNDWDIATLEFGINIVNFVTPDDFRQRVEYFVSTLVKTHPDKHIVLISTFPFNERQGIVIPEKATGTYTVDDLAYCQIMRDVQKSFGHKNLHFIEGSDIMDEFNCVSADMLHPRNYGHAVMGLNLAARLKDLAGL